MCPLSYFKYLYPNTHKYTGYTLQEGDRKYVCGGIKCQPTASYFECCAVTSTKNGTLVIGDSFKPDVVKTTLQF